MNATQWPTHVPPPVVEGGRTSSLPGVPALTDLTDLLAGDNVLAWPHLAHIRTETWQRSSKHGRIFGIPNEDPVLIVHPFVQKFFTKGMLTGAIKG